MTERRFDTEYWNSPAIMDLPMKAKMLYLYLWTNTHCNQAGLYTIAVKTISFETGLPMEEIPDLLKVLTKKVVWVRDQNLIWVKSFLRHQSRSPQFLAAAAKCLEKIDNNGLVDDFMAYNHGYNLSIPYFEGMNRVAVGPYTTSLSHSKSLSLSSKEKEVVKGKETLSAEDQEIVSVWKAVAGFEMEMPAIMELLAKVREDFPDVDILTESKSWAARKISEPLKPTSRPSNQIYNFMVKRHQWNQEEQEKKDARDKYGYCKKCHYSGPPPPIYKKCPRCGGPYVLRVRHIE